MTGPVKNVVDGLAIGGGATSVVTANGGVPMWMEWLPYIAAGLSALWLAIRLGEWLWQKAGRRIWARVRRWLPFS